MNYIRKYKPQVIEGELRCQQLVNYLERIHAPKQIWISEDASGIVPKVAYDSVTNQLVGLTLPINGETGVPTSISFTPKTLTDIDQQIKSNSKSTLVYIVLAQPIKENAAPFILQVYGTNNRFTTANTLQRWKHTRDELAKSVFCFILIMSLIHMIERIFHHNIC